MDPSLGERQSSQTSTRLGYVTSYIGRAGASIASSVNTVAKLAMRSVVARTSRKALAARSSTTKHDFDLDSDTFDEMIGLPSGTADAYEVTLSNDVQQRTAKTKRKKQAAKRMEGIRDELVGQAEDLERRAKRKFQDAEKVTKDINVVNASIADDEKEKAVVKEQLEIAQAIGNESFDFYKDATPEELHTAKGWTSAIICLGNETLQMANEPPLQTQGDLY